MVIAYIRPCGLDHGSAGERSLEQGNRTSKSFGVVKVGLSRWVAPLFGYDALNNRTWLTDPDNNVTAWAFDGLNRATTETNSLSQVRSFGYNAAGDLTSQTDRNGRVTNYVYDNLHRRTQEKWMSGSTVLNTFAYNFDSASQLTSASATGTQMAYTFDNLGRVLTASNAGTTNIPTTVQTNVYDANSRRTQQTATVASVADYKNTWTYDNANRRGKIVPPTLTGMWERVIVYTSRCQRFSERRSLGCHGSIERRFARRMRFRCFT